MCVTHCQIKMAQIYHVNYNQTGRVLACHIFGNSKNFKEGKRPKVLIMSFL